MKSTPSKYLTSLVIASCTANNLPVPAKFLPPKPRKQKDNGFRAWGSNPFSTGPMGFSFTPQRNQRKIRKARRQRAAAGDKKAFTR